MAHEFSRPLSDHEMDDLSDLLDAVSPLDLDGLFGVLHAVVVAPGMLMPSAWLPMVLPEGPGDSHGIDLMLRLYNQVVDAIDHDEAYIPPEEDLEACASFAAGYASAAALDPAWVGDADRWTFAAGIAYLGGQRDLVPAGTLAELDALPDGESAVRRLLASIVSTTYETFLEVRRAAFPAQAARAPRRVRRVGRNEPCPCGSGKRYKRCCIDRPPEAGAG